MAGLGAGGETYDVDDVAKAKEEEKAAAANAIQYGAAEQVRIGTADRGDTGIRR